MSLLRSTATKLIKSTHTIKISRNFKNSRIIITQPHPLVKSSGSSWPSLYFSSQTCRLNPENIAQEILDLITLLRVDLKQSMKIKDLTQRDVIKSLMGDLQNSEHTKNPKSQEEVIDSAIKKRLEAARIASETNPPREEINQQNLKEVKILQKYQSFLSLNNSPTTTTTKQTLTQDELIKIVQESIQKLGLSVDVNTSLQERQTSLRKLIRSVKENVDSSVDGKRIADAVKKLLQLP